MVPDLILLQPIIIIICKKKSCADMKNINTVPIKYSVLDGLTCLGITYVLYTNRWVTIVLH